MNVFIKSNGRVMVAYSYGKPVVGWSREKRQLVNPYTHEPISHATMLDFTTLIEKGEK